jgi:hypothetical protein
MTQAMPVEEIKCVNLDEFWNVISLSTEQYADYIFRGQADATWKLNSSLARMIEKPEQGHAAYFKQYIEAYSICEFVRYCDQARIEIPGDSQSFRKKVHFLPNEALHGIQEKDWPPSDLYNIIALMQHFDHPTSFLDWTRVPYVAAFFAASEIICEKNEVSSFAVWQLRTDFESCP